MEGRAPLLRTLNPEKNSFTMQKKNSAARAKSGKRLSPFARALLTFEIAFTSASDLQLSKIHGISRQNISATRARIFPDALARRSMQAARARRRAENRTQWNGNKNTLENEL